MGIPLQSASASADVLDGAVVLEPRITASKRASRPAARSGPAKLTGRLTTDSIGWYLGTIGRVPLLTPAEEIELAHHVRQGKEVLQLPAETLTSIGATTDPTVGFTPLPESKSRTRKKKG